MLVKNAPSTLARAEVLGYLRTVVGSLLAVLRTVLRAHRPAGVSVLRLRLRVLRSLLRLLRGMLASRRAERRAAVVCPRRDDLMDATPGAASA